ncbi:MAG: Ferredoxin--NADP reductase [Calditrichaeota bacterium]|nr:Ferredoxin--NADP reductase [Calditrichota bacterium]
MIETAIYLGTALIVVLVPALYWYRERRKSTRAATILTKAKERGLDEPVSLHPVIDPDICIGSGACVRACPEQNVLGLINNAGALINPGNCIGHGLCQAACPVNAITLVFGTEKRGVDVPHLKGTFETNVPGVYIVGELGGMGLIRNAVTQGREAAEYIARSLEDERDGRVRDLVIVGAGPAGLAAALQAKREKLDFVVVDQEDFGGTILTYPRRKLVMTQPMELPGYGRVKLREVHKESLLELFEDVVHKVDVKVNAGEKVNDIERVNGHFRVTTTRDSYEAKRVLLAIGRRGSPRKLGVPGEKSSRVTYRMLDPEKYQGLNVLVVGGGDSAVEAALALADQPGNSVQLSYRRDALVRVKEGNRERFEQAVADGKLEPIFNSNVTRIDEGVVLLDVGGEERALDNDQVFVFIGGELPTALLEKVGIEFSRKFGEA